MPSPSGRTDSPPQGQSDSGFLIPSVFSWKLDSGEQGLSPSSSEAWEMLQKLGSQQSLGGQAAGRLGMQRSDGKWYAFALAIFQGGREGEATTLRSSSFSTALVLNLSNAVAL